MTLCHCLNKGHRYTQSVHPVVRPGEMMASFNVKTAPVFRWSLSMLVTILMSGIHLRNERRFHLLSPQGAVPGTGVSVVSRVAANQVSRVFPPVQDQATMAEVVVLPWAPATAAIFFRQSS